MLIKEWLEDHLSLDEPIEAMPPEWWKYATPDERQSFLKFLQSNGVRISDSQTQFPAFT